MNFKAFIFLGLSLFLLAILSCKKDPANEVCAEYDVFYNGDIKEIINNSCAFNFGCHSGDWAVLPDFSYYEEIAIYCNSGIFQERIFTTDSFQIMPPLHNVPEENQLTTVQKQILSCWFEEGFPED